MMQNNYTLHIVQKNGIKVIPEEDISCANVVELTSNTENIPTHIFTGLTFIRRFCRGFISGTGGGMKEYLHCIICAECRIYVSSATGTVTITPPNVELYV